MFMFFFEQKTAYGVRISDWSSDVCSSDLSVDEKTRSSSEANLNELFAASSPIRQHSHIAAISSGRICASALTIRYDTLFLLLSVNGRFAKPFCPRGKEGQPAAQCNWLKGVGIPTGKIGRAHV